MNENVQTMDREAGFDRDRAKRVGQVVRELRGNRKQEVVARLWEELHAAGVGGNAELSRIEKGDPDAIARTFRPWSKRAEHLCDALDADEGARRRLQRELRGRPLLVLDAMSFGRKADDLRDVLKWLSAEAERIQADVVTVATRAQQDELPPSLSAKRVEIVADEATARMVCDRAGHDGVIVSARWQGQAGVLWPIAQWIAAVVHAGEEPRSYGYSYDRRPERKPATMTLSPANALALLAAGEPLPAPVAVEESLADFTIADPDYWRSPIADAIDARKTALELASPVASPKTPSYDDSEMRKRAALGRLLGVRGAMLPDERERLHRRRALQELRVAEYPSGDWRTGLARDRVRFGVAELDVVASDGPLRVFATATPSGLTPTPHAEVELVQRAELPLGRARAILRERTLDEWISDSAARRVVDALVASGFERSYSEHAVAQELVGEAISLAPSTSADWREAATAVLALPVPAAGVVSSFAPGLDVSAGDVPPIVPPVVVTAERTTPRAWRWVTLSERNPTKHNRDTWRSGFASQDADDGEWLDAFHGIGGRIWERSGDAWLFGDRTWDARDEALGAIWLELREAVGREAIDLHDGRGLVRLRRNLYVVVRAYHHANGGTTRAWIREAARSRHPTERLAAGTAPPPVSEFVFHAAGYAVHLTTRWSPWKELAALR